MLQLPSSSQGPDADRQSVTPLTRLGLSPSPAPLPFHKCVTCKLGQQGMAVAAVWTCSCLHAARLMRRD